MALTVPVKEKLRSLFDWVPLDAIAAAWDQVPAIFFGLLGVNQAWGSGILFPISAACSLGRPWMH
ncbi:hypothetical protein ACFS4T_07020 [Pseudomonas lini]